MFEFDTLGLVSLSAVMEVTVNLPDAIHLQKVPVSGITVSTLFKMLMKLFFPIRCLMISMNGIMSV